MGRRLAAGVHVRHPKTNEQLILQPGDEPDEDLAEVITHPDAWEPDEDDDASESGEAAGDGSTEPDPAPTPEPDPEAKPTRSRTRKPADEQ
ncbi:hypothetical protein ACWCPF_42865 [Streptomyces sp. NPDC001858]